MLKEKRYKCIDLFEFSKASKEVAIDVPNKFITFDLFPSILIS